MSQGGSNLDRAVLAAQELADQVAGDIRSLQGQEQLDVYMLRMSEGSTHAEALVAAQQVSPGAAAQTESRGQPNLGANTSGPSVRFGTSPPISPGRSSSGGAAAPVMSRTLAEGSLSRSGGVGQEVSGEEGSERAESSATGALRSALTARARDKRRAHERVPTGESEGAGRSQARQRTEGSRHAHTEAEEDEDRVVVGTARSKQASSSRSRQTPEARGQPRQETPTRNPKDALLMQFAEYSPNSRQQVLDAFARMTRFPATSDDAHASPSPQGPRVRQQPPLDLGRGSPLASDRSQFQVQGPGMSPSPQMGYGHQQQHFHLGQGQEGFDPQGTNAPSFGNPRFNESSRIPSGLVGAGPHHDSVHPGYIRAKTVGDPIATFNPQGILGTFLQLPAAGVLTKIASLQYVALWHFTKEGMAAGHEKAVSYSEAGRKLLEQLGSSDAAVPKAKIRDEFMSFELFYRASANQLEIIRYLAGAEHDPVKKHILLTEADAWEKQYSLAIKALSDWPVVIHYIASVRETYYKTPVGLGRLSPFLWQPAIWDNSERLRREGRLPRADEYSPVAAYLQQGSTQGQAESSAQRQSQGGSRGGFISEGAWWWTWCWLWRVSRSGPKPSSTTPSAPAEAHQQVGRSPTRPERTEVISSESAMADPSVCYGTGVSAPEQKLVKRAGNTSAPSADTRAMGHTNALVMAQDLRPELAALPRPLDADGLQSALEELGLMDAFGEIVRGVRDGFDFGIPAIRETKTPPNHKSAVVHKEVLKGIAKAEVEKGRWIGPFSQQEVEDLIGPFQSSPMGVIPKANGKFRPVQDFSFPRNDSYTSINKFIESDEFITGWDGVNDAFKAINDLPNNIQGATMDAQEAFRACPARISQLPGMVVMLEEGEFYMDFFLGFGLSSATGVWGKVGDCTKAIIEGRLVGRVKVLKWVDDFLILRLDPSVTVEEIMRVTEDINFPWNPAKTIDFSDSPRYIGWVFDIARRKVILPRDKADKYKDRALPFTEGGKQSLKDTMKLLGSLQHVAYVSRDLRPWLSELSGFVAGWEQNKPFQMRHVKPEVQREAAKWVAELSLVPFIRSFARPAKVFEPKVWVDASSEWGIGVIVGDAWSAWSWTPGWDSDGRNIGWAEAVALELGLRAALALGARDSLVKFFSDNQGVLFGYKLGRSRGKQVNSVLKRVVDLERDEKVRLDI
ncbi:hypothetical protein A4X03_0g7648, partial [Tilletia caries]